MAETVKTYESPFHGLLLTKADLAVAASECPSSKDKDSAMTLILIKSTVPLLTDRL